MGIGLKLMRALLALPGILFLFSGLRWLVDPDTAAQQLGMPLLSGVGLSTQIGDLSAFFLLLGLFILTGVVMQKRHWFYAPVVLLLLAACSRLLAWLFHDASLAVQLIMPEIIIAALLWFGSKLICDRATLSSDQS